VVGQCLAELSKKDEDTKRIENAVKRLTKGSFKFNFSFKKKREFYYIANIFPLFFLVFYLINFIYINYCSF
jgi:hypothetical protein